MEEQIENKEQEIIQLDNTEQFDYKVEFDKLQSAFDEKLNKIKNDYEKTISEQQNIITQLLTKDGAVPANEPDLIDIKIAELNELRDKQNKI